MTTKRAQGASSPALCACLSPSAQEAGPQSSFPGQPLRFLSGYRPILSLSLPLLLWGPDHTGAGGQGRGHGEGRREGGI